MTITASCVRGLARNPSASTALLLDLLGAAPVDTATGLRRRPILPAALQQAMLRRDEPAVLMALAEHPDVTVENRAWLALRPADWRVRIRAFGRPGQRPLPDEVLVDLLSDIEDIPPGSVLLPHEAFEELVEAMRWDPRLYRLAATHPRKEVRLRSLWGRHVHGGQPDIVATLLADPDPEVREAIAAALAEDARVMRPEDIPAQHTHGLWWALQRPLSRAVVDQAVARDDPAELHFVATNPTTPPDVVSALLRHPAPEIRSRVATRPGLTSEQLARLAADPAVEVRTAVSVHPGLTEEQVAGIGIDVTTVPGHGHYGPGERCQVPHDDRAPAHAAALRWARSVNPLLRRRAARDPGLPGDLVDALAGDEDLGVRVLLARHHPEAPPELLLRSYLDYRGCGRPLLRDNPRFPRTDLARFAGDDDPAVRLLAALDLEAPPDLLDRLTRDPDEAVRRAATAAPRLPTDRIVALLDNDDLAEDAAANPALPEAEIRRISTSAAS